MRISRLTLFLLIVVAALALAACAVPPPAGSGQKNIEEAVQATLTAVAAAGTPAATSQAAPAEGTAAPVATSGPAAAKPAEGTPQPAAATTPEPTLDLSQGKFVMPGTIPNFKAAERPASSKGDANAPVVMYEWSDFTCSHCKEFNDNTLPILEDAYIKTGKLRFVQKEFPVVNGDLSVVAALAAQCAGDQDKYWEMHDWLFANVPTWANQDALAKVKEGARTAGADGAKFDTCFDQQTPIQRIVEDFREGQSFDIQGTPAFVVNGHFIPGAMPVIQFRQMIDALITEAETGSLPDTVVTVTPSPTPDTNFDVAKRPVQGKADAAVTIVEFTDYQCPFCEKYFTETLPQIRKDYVDTGKVKYIVMNFPLTSIHPQAMPAAIAAECANAQGKYWEMHDKLFGSQSEWAGKDDAVDTFKKYAAGLGLDKDKFAACMNNSETKTAIDAEQQAGMNGGVTGTPAFFINGALLSGAQPIEAFKQVIDEQLAKAGTK